MKNKNSLNFCVSFVSGALFFTEREITHMKHGLKIF